MDIKRNFETNCKKTGFWIILVLSIFIIISFIYLLTPLFRIICWSGILAFFIYPAYKFVKIKFFKNYKSLSAIFVMILFIIFIIGPLSLILLNFYYQLFSFLQNLQPMTEKDFSQYLEQLKNHPKIYLIISKFLSQIHIYLPQLQDKLAEFLSNLIQTGVQSLKNVIQIIVSFGFQLAFTLITLYYFLVDGDRIVKEILDLIPGEPYEKQKILKRVSLILKGVLYGNILTAIIQGFLALLIYFFLGIPQYLLWAFLTVLASFIPVFGTSLIWGPLVIYLLITGSYVKATILIIYAIIIISQIDNFIKPILIGEKTKIHNLLIFFSVLGGLIKFGALGLFLGPLILGLFLCIIEIYKIKWLNQTNNNQNYIEN